MSVKEASPRRVAWISCVAEKGGAEVYMMRFMQHYDPRHWIPEVVLLRPGPLEEELREAGWTVHVLKRHRMREIHHVGSSLLELHRLCRQQGWDLIHSNGFRAHLYGGLVACWNRLPEIWTTHTDEQPGLFTRLVRSIPTARVVGNCHRTCNDYVQAGLPTTLIWAPIDPEGIQLTSREQLAATYGLPQDSAWITVAARLQRFKGHEHFIRALAALPHDAPPFHGIITGGTLFGMEPDYPNQLKQLAAELGVLDRLTLTGFIPDQDLHGILCSSSMLVHPAESEDFGLSVAEAQSYGVQVVAYDASGPCEIIRHQETGWLVPNGQQAELNRAIPELLGQPEQGTAWGAQGRIRSMGLYHARVLTKRLQQVYEEALRDQSTRRPMG